MSGEGMGLYKPKPNEWYEFWNAKVAGSRGDARRDNEIYHAFCAGYGIGFKEIDDGNMVQPD